MSLWKWQEIQKMLYGQGALALAEGFNKLSPLPPV